MKCAYKAILHQRRVEEDERLVAIQEQRSRANLFALVLQTAEDQFKFDTDQLKKMMDGMFEEASDAFKAYKDDSQEDFDPTTVPFMLQAFVNQLNALEVNVRAIEDEYYFPPVATTFWSNGRLQKQKDRERILDDRKVTYRAYLYSFMLYLYHEYGYEGEKLEKFYRGVRDRYYTLWRRYLECNSIEDSTLAGLIDLAIMKIENKGIDLTGMTDVDKETDKKEGEKENG